MRFAHALIFLPGTPAATTRSLWNTSTGSRVLQVASSQMTGCLVRASALIASSFVYTLSCQFCAVFTVVSDSLCCSLSSERACLIRRKLRQFLFGFGTELSPGGMSPIPATDRRGTSFKLALGSLR